MRQDPHEPLSPPIEVPKESLNPETLQALIESYIFREGTDYGREEVEHSKKIEQVQKQIRTGSVKIIFDPNSESVTLVTDRDWKKIQAQFADH